MINENPLVIIRDDNVYLEGVCVGHIVGNTYVSDRIPERNFYILGHGYPISEKILLILKEKGIKYILIIEHGKKGIRKFIGNIEDYLNGQIVLHDGYEKQRCLDINKMTLVD